jgi:ubiquinone/menaquinone biosynthesis C-methylase UbiE
MGVAAHLGIDLAEYDARIRTFIPDYDEMLDAAAAVVRRDARRILDLGTGTGALAARCLARAPHARLIGVDADPAMAGVAAERIGRRAAFVTGDFARLDLPRCDTIVSSFALHHVRTRRAKAALYVRLRRTLALRGRLIVVDCMPAPSRDLADDQRDAWRRHLRRSYRGTTADRFLRAWSKEDVYVPLDVELDLMRRAALAPEIVWRKGAFAVIRAITRRQR